MAAGIATSMAANVYSQNIVGYVNKVFLGSGQYTLVANPLDNGTNDLVSLLDAALPNKSTVYAWDQTNGKYIQVNKNGSGAANWTTNLLAPPGTGFFVKTPNASGPVTNVFVGQLAGGIGSGD